MEGTTGVTRGAGLPVTRGESRGGRRRASAVCRFHGPRGGICLPASKANTRALIKGLIASRRRGLRTAIKFKCLVSLLGGDVAFCGRARAGAGRGVRRELASAPGLSSSLRRPLFSRRHRAGLEPRPRDKEPFFLLTSSGCLKQNRRSLDSPAERRPGGRRRGDGVRAVAPWSLAGSEPSPMPSVWDAAPSGPEAWPSFPELPGALLGSGGWGCVHLELVGWELCARVLSSTVSLPVWVYGHQARPSLRGAGTHHAGGGTRFVL